MEEQGRKPRPGYLPTPPTPTHQHASRRVQRHGQHASPAQLLGDLQARSGPQRRVGQGRAGMTAVVLRRGPAWDAGTAGTRAEMVGMLLRRRQAGRQAAGMSPRCRTHHAVGRGSHQDGIHRPLGAVLHHQAGRVHACAQVLAHCGTWAGGRARHASVGSSAACTGSARSPVRELSASVARISHWGSPLGWRRRAMSAASLCRLASAERCCTDAVALAVRPPGVSTFTATIVSCQRASHTWHSEGQGMAAGRRTWHMRSGGNGGGRASPGHTWPNEPSPMVRTSV